MNRSRITGDLVSQNNIFVDIANDRVGIGSTIPTQKLDVTGIVKATSFSGDGTNLSGIDTDLVSDTSPQLGGNLDVNGKDIISTSNGDIEFTPNGTGAVVFKGVSSNGGNGAGRFKLNCEVNSHGITIQGPPHSAGANYTLTLPNTDGNANQLLKSDGSGNLDWVNITNANVDASAAIAGTKIDPDFGSQTIVTKNIQASGYAAITGTPHNYQYGRGGQSGGLSIYAAEGAIEVVSTEDSTHGGSLLLRTVTDGAGFVYNSTDNALELKLFTPSGDNFTIHGSGNNHSSLDTQLRVVKDAQVELAHNGSVKLATSSSGIDVTGTITGNNLTLSDNDPELTFTDLNNNPDHRIKAESGNLSFEDTTNGNVARLRINADGHVDVTGNLDVGAGIDVTGNITVSGTVDGRDVAADGSKLDGIESGATADQSASDIKTLLQSSKLTASEIANDTITAVQLANGAADVNVVLDGAIVNSKVNANAAIAGTKISPNFGSQAITTTGVVTSGTELIISGTEPRLTFVDTDNNPDFQIWANAQKFQIFDSTNSTTRLLINSSGNIGINQNSPQGKLHISSGTSGDCELILESDTDNNNENDNARVIFRQDGGANQSAIGTEDNELVLYNSVPSGGIVFKTGSTSGYTNATERLRITTDKVMFSVDAKVDSNNQRDLGTSSNRWKSLFLGTQLEIDAASSTEMIRLDVAGTNFATIGHNTSSGTNMLDVRSEGHTRFLTNGNNERLRITSGGNIGMGVVGHDPLTKLHVQDSANGALKDVLTITNENGGTNTEVGMVFECGTDEVARISAKNEGSDIGPLIFSTASSTNANPTEKLRITSGGLVDIRGGNLHVGTDGATANFTDSNNGNTKHIEIGATGGGDALLTTHASGKGIGYFGYEAGGDRLIIACDDGSANNKIDFVTNAGTSTGGNTDNLNGKHPKMRVKSGGGGVQIFVHESATDFQPKHDVTALLIQNGIGGGDIGNTSEPTHIDWAWVDSNSNVTPQCRISGNVGNGGDPNSLELEGKGFLNFHCSDSNSASGDLDPPQRLRIAHDGTFTGSQNNNISDQRLKENIATITDPITKIKALKGRTFTWKSEARMREGTHYGFIAQEVESIIPDLIVDNTGIRVFDKDDNLLPSNVITPPVGGGYAKSVTADGVTPVLVEALKEALAKIEVLEAKVAALEG